MSNLTTLANAKQWLGITSPDSDSLLERLISAASDYIQTWLNRDIALASYVSRRDGTGGTRLMLRNYPVVAMSSVVVDGQSVPFSTDGIRPGYIFNDTSVMLVGNGYRFNRGYSNVLISYTAGFSSIPTEIEQAAIELISLRYKEKDRIGIISKGLAGETISYTQKDFTDSIENALKNYKKVILE